MGRSQRLVEVGQAPLGLGAAGRGLPVLLAERGDLGFGLGDLVVRCTLGLEVLEESVGVALAEAVDLLLHVRVIIAVGGCIVVGIVVGRGGGGGGLRVVVVFTIAD